MRVSNWDELRLAAVPAVESATLSARWARLSLSAQEPSCMQLPDMQLALLAVNPKAQVLTVVKADELLLALPVQSAGSFDRTTSSAFTCCNLPLVSRVMPQQAVAAFINNLTRPLLIKDLPTEGAFMRQLTQAQGIVQVMHNWQRAALRVQGTYEAWADQNFDTKRRKEFKRLRKRLAEKGDLRLETLNHSSDFNGFVEEYIELEARGWKGNRGTALKSKNTQSETFRNICQALHSSGRLRFWLLRLDGKAIAALYGVVFGTQAQIIKITYDEDFAKYSPGVQIVLDATEAFFAEPGLETVDSCAIPDHPMINRIWRERIGMADVLVAPAHYAMWKFNSLYIGLKLEAKLRAMAKLAFLTLTGRKKS